MELFYMVLLELRQLPFDHSGPAIQIALGAAWGASDTSRSEQSRNMFWQQRPVELLSARSRRLCRSGPVAALLGFGLLLGSVARAQAGDATPVGAGSLSAPLDPEDNPTNGLGSWIWAATTLDRQTCQLWRAIEIPNDGPVAHARLVMTADNEFTLYLDGRELGRGAEWRELFDYDVTQRMSPGTHILAIKAYNSSGFAGMLLGLRIHLADGRVIEVKSDPSWRIVPEGTRGWETRGKPPKTWPVATVIVPFGGDPWKEVPVRVNLMPVSQPVKVFFWQTGWFQVSLLALSGLVILISLRLVAQVALHRKEQWLLLQERMRIARDIHDDLGSRMTQLVLHGEVAQSDLPQDSETRFQIDRICEEARGILSTMDEILWAVNPKRDAFRDFTSFICGYAQEFFKPTRIQCLFDVDPQASSAVLSLPLKRALLMVTKEALNNILKHSHATEVVLKVKCQGQRLVVVVSDNGKGFDSTTTKPSRNGLVNMSQRMSELGGSCTITSQRGKGCQTEFSLPLRQPQGAAWGWTARLAALFGARRNRPRNRSVSTFANP